MRQLSGTHFFKSFSDGLFRAFRGPKASASAHPSRTEPSSLPSRSEPNHMPVVSAPYPWLTDFNWEKVLTMNQAQCQLQNTQMTPNPKSYDQVKGLWEQRAMEKMSLEKALDFCRECEQRAPFVFSNTSTFSQVGKALVEELVKGLPSLEAHIVRNTAARYVSGDVSKRELFDILRFYEAKWRPGLDRVSRNGASEHPRPQADA